MISFEKASRAVLALAQPLGKERVPLEEADGRILAEPVTAAIDAPRADVSAMDGYAVREADLDKLPARLTVTGNIFPSQAPEPIAAGTCVRIFTGACLPPNADRVVMQENVQRDDEQAVFAQLSSARHIRRRGADFRTGEILLPAGRQLDARSITAAAAADCATLSVWRSPRFSLLATGDELVAPGSAGETPAMIPESISYGIAAMARHWGGTLDSTRRIKDEVPLLERAAAASVAEADLVVVTGGASVGDKDFAKTIFAAVGMDLVFAKVAIKPGKPVWQSNGPLDIEILRPLGSMLAHPPALQAAVMNLLSNAMKFVQPGKQPKIIVRSERMGDQLRLWVEDNGIGLASEHAERIFKPFQRLHGSESYPGTGIGLAIVRRVAERMGGSSGVMSEPGKGARFWIEMKAAEEPA